MAKDQRNGGTAGPVYLAGGRWMMMMMTMMMMMMMMMTMMMMMMGVLVVAGNTEGAINRIKDNLG